MDWSPEQTERVRLLYFDQGLSATKIGKLFGVSRHSIIGRMYRKFGPLKATEAFDRKGWNKVHRAKEAVRKAVKPRKAKSRPMTPQTTIARPERALRLVELSARDCRWIIDYQDGEALFCAGERMDDPTCWYCGFHRKMAWVKRG